MVVRTDRIDACTTKLAKLLGATAISLIALQAGQAHAQDTQSAQDQQAAEPAEQIYPGTEEIIVTARKRAENIQNTPISITAIGAAELEARSAVDLTAIQNVAPNLTLRQGGQSSGASFTPVIAIRGIGQGDFVINTDPGVGIYIDGVYLGRSLGSVLDLADVERVEVLRGPQGTLFGRNSIGGAVSVVSKAPSMDSISGMVSAAAGNRQFLNGRASLNLPISDTLAVRVSAMARNREGYVDALQYDDLKLGAEEVWGVRGALRFQPTSTLTFDLGVDHSERRETPAPAVALALGGLSPTDSGSTGRAARFFNSGMGPAATARVPWISVDAPRCENDAAFRNSSRTCYGNAWLAGNFATNAVWQNRSGAVIRPENALNVTGYNGTVTFESALGTLKSITAYRRFGSTFYGDPDFTPFTIFANNHDAPIDGEAPFNQQQFSQEVQLVGSAFGDRLDYVFGLYHFDEKGDESVDALVPANVAPVNAPFLPFFQTAARTIDNKSQAAYAQITFAATDRLKLTGGIRYTDETKDFTISQSRATGPAASASGFQQTKIWTPMFNVAWQATDDILTYATYSEGYRAGGFASRFADGLISPLPSYDPEYVTSYELGFKSTLLDRRLRFNLAAFHMDYDDIQVQANLPGLNSFVLNLATARYRGFEAEMRAVLGGGFTANVSAGYVNKKLTKVAPGVFTDAETNVGVAITTDSKLPWPDWQLTGQLAHRYEMDNGGRLDTSFDIRFESEDVNSISNYDIMVQEAYAEADARITYTLPDEKTSLTLGARNLFDTTYFTQKRLSAVTGSVFGTVGRPREVFVQATYRFGR